MPGWTHRLLPWPLPALLVWGGAWLLYRLLLLAGLPLLAAALVATGLSVAASVLGRNWWRRVLLALGFPLSLVVLLASAGSVSAWAWLLPLAVLLLIYPLNAWRDAPLFPTPTGALDGLAPTLDLPAQPRILDAGCGLGAGLRALRRAWPQAHLHGVEWSWLLRWACALRCPWAKVRQGNMWTHDWRGYDVVYLFQRPESMSRAMVKAITDLPAGAWLVSLNFPLPDEVAPTHSQCLPDGRSVYAYRAPLAEVDSASLAASEQASFFPPAPEGVQVRGQMLYPRKRPPGGRRR